MQNGGNWTFNELKASFQKYYEKGARNGLIDNKEVIIGEINSQGLLINVICRLFWISIFCALIVTRILQGIIIDWYLFFQESLVLLRKLVGSRVLSCVDLCYTIILLCDVIAFLLL